MKQKIYFHLSAVMISMAPLAYLAYQWKSIPSIIPLHYNYKLMPDRFGDKSFLWEPAVAIAIVGVLVYTLLVNIPRLDKRLKGSSNNDVFFRIALVVAVFISLLNFLILRSISSQISILFRALVPISSLLIACIGNYMYSIKPNYYAGFRISWTLSSDFNWKKTHQIGAKVWFWGGIATAFLGLLLPFTYAVICFIFFMLLIFIVPGVYSYRIHKAEKNQIGG